MDPNKIISYFRCSIYTFTMADATRREHQEVASMRIGTSHYKMEITPLVLSQSFPTDHLVLRNEIYVIVCFLTCSFAIILSSFSLVKGFVRKKLFCFSFPVSPENLKIG